MNVIIMRIRLIVINNLLLDKVIVFIFSLLKKKKGTMETVKSVQKRKVGNISIFGKLKGHKS